MAADPQKQVIAEVRSQTLQGAACCLLSDVQTLGSSRNIALCKKRIQRAEQIEVEMTEIHSYYYLPR